MTWSTTQDIREFADSAMAFLSTRAVEHTVLLTETAYLTAHPRAGDDQLYGWWADQDGKVAGAFLQAPGHSPVASRLPADALGSLPTTLRDATRVEVSSSDVDAAVAAWLQHGIELAPRSRIRIHRLAQLRRRALPPGRARVAGASDRALLVTWFEDLMAGALDDATELEYAVDDPLGYGGLTLWELDGEPVAMAGRSRVVAGMVRVGPVHSPEPGRGYDVAATVAACTSALRLARDVLVLTPADDDEATSAYRSLGFEPVRERVLLTAVHRER